MLTLTDNIVLKVVAEIDDPVTTTDELIPSGETSRYRSNPLGLLSLHFLVRDPEYVGSAKEIQKAEKARLQGNDPVAANEEVKTVFDKIKV